MRRKAAAESKPLLHSDGYFDELGRRYACPGDRPLLKCKACHVWSHAVLACRHCGRLRDKIVKVKENNAA